MQQGGSREPRAAFEHEREDGDVGRADRRHEDDAEVRRRREDEHVGRRPEGPGRRQLRGRVGRVVVERRVVRQFLLLEVLVTYILE